MLKELLKNREFCRIINNFLENEKVIDVILAGSALKGKEEPEDIDIFVIYQQVKNTLELDYELRKKLEKTDKRVKISGKNYEDLFKPEFIAREAILQGYSFKAKKMFSEGLGYKNFVLFRYSLGEMNKSKRMQFYYALHGRGEETGLLKKNKCYKFSDSVILCMINNSEIIKEFFEKWGIECLSFPVMIPERIAKYKIEQ